MTAIDPAEAAVALLPHRALLEAVVVRVEALEVEVLPVEEVAAAVAEVVMRLVQCSKLANHDLPLKFHLFT